jgi:preprotein translocase subunit YajC
MLTFASFAPLLQAAAAAGADKAAAAGSNPTMGMLTTLVPIGLLFVVFYFVLIRPQNKKQKETKKMLESLKKGDRIVTIGGIHGQVTSVKENSVIVKVDDACKLEFLRSAIASVVSREDAEPAEKASDKASSEADKK